MEELIRITESPNGEKAVSARELYVFLTEDELMNQAARWLKTNIENNEYAVENVDYQKLRHRVGKGRPSIDYALSLDFAKELCIQSQCKKGKEARLYFIAVEKNYKQMLMAGAKDLALLQAYEKISDAVIAVAEKNLNLDQRLSALEQSISKAVPIETYFSVKDYLVMTNKYFDKPTVAAIGRTCSAYCKVNNIEIRKTPHELYAYRNTYPVSVIKMFI